MMIERFLHCYIYVQQFGWYGWYRLSIEHGDGHTALSSGAIQLKPKKIQRLFDLLGIELICPEFKPLPNDLRNMPELEIWKSKVFAADIEKPGLPVGKIATITGPSGVKINLDEFINWRAPS